MVYHSGENIDNRLHQAPLVSKPLVDSGNEELNSGSSGRRDSSSFEFIVTTPSQRSSREQQRRVRGHATRTRPRKRHPLNLPSRMGQQPVSNKQIQKVDNLVASTINIPSPVGTGICSNPFSGVMQPYMLQRVFQFLAIIKDELYPPELCLQVNSANTTGIGYMFSDQVYSHSIMYFTEAYFDQVSGREPSMRSQYHLYKTLRLLQERVSVPHDPLTISDGTIMAIICLALASDVLERGESVANHMEGLESMVNMRGGFDAMQSLNSMISTKICRVDLSSAIRFKRRPIFFREHISWGPYLSGKKMGFPPDTPTAAAVASFMQLLDPKLANVWWDLKQFSVIINLASQSGRKMTSATYSEIVPSVLYRLLHRSCESDPAHEALRLALLTFAVGIFFRWGDMKQNQDHVAQMYHYSLNRLRASEVSVPKELEFWLLMIWYISVLRPTEDDQFDSWVTGTIGTLQITSWEQAREILKSAMWIDTIHDSNGELVWSKMFKSQPKQ